MKKLKRCLFFLLMIVKFSLLSSYAQITSGDISDNSGYHLKVTASSAAVKSNEPLEYTVSFVFPVEPSENGNNFSLDFVYSSKFDVILASLPSSYSPVGGAVHCNPITQLHRVW